MADQKPAPIQPPPFKLAFTVDEACAALGIGRTKLYQLSRAGEIEIGRFAGRAVIPRQSLEACWSRLYQPQKAA